MSGYPFMSNAEHARNIRITLDAASTTRAMSRDGGGGRERDEPAANKYNRCGQIQSSAANDAAKWTLFDTLKNAFASH